MILGFDTETTNKADFRAPLDAAHQPHIVQLAALLIDDAEKEVMSVNLIIRPDGYEIPLEASAIHGITTEYATKVGVDIRDALLIFSSMKRAADIYVAHNIDFDRMMIGISVTRQASLKWTDESMPAAKCFCTMKAMTPICELPGPYGFKWPKLQEAYKHAFGCGFDGAHDALADIRACAKVFFWLKKQSPQLAHDEVPNAD